METNSTPKKRGRPAKVKEEVKEAPKLNAMGRPIKEVPSPTEYTLTLSLGGNTYSGTGLSIEEALKNTNVPHKITTKGTIRLTDGTKSTERNFMPYEIKRFFYPVSRFYMAKYLSITLK